MFWILLILAGIITGVSVSIFITRYRATEKRTAELLRKHSVRLESLEPSSPQSPKPQPANKTPQIPRPRIAKETESVVRKAKPVINPKPVIEQKPKESGLSISEPSTSLSQRFPDWIEPAEVQEIGKSPAKPPLLRLVESVPKPGVSFRPSSPVTGLPPTSTPTIPNWDLPIFKGLVWRGPGEPIVVSGIRIEEPNCYIRDSRSNEFNQDFCAIDVSLPAASSKYVPYSPNELQYWPRYDSLTPGQRRYYLDWLATERNVWPHEIGYVFLYFYGLERRCLVDERDEQFVFNKILELRDLYLRFAVPEQKTNRSFEVYSNLLLWYLLVRFPASFTSDYLRAIFEQSVGDKNEEHIASALSWLSTMMRPLPDWIAYELAEILPNSKRSVVLQRVPQEHRDLFIERFRKEFPNGLPFSDAKRSRKFQYRPAHGFLRTQECHGPNPYGRASQFAPLSELWNCCVEDLKKLSSKVSRTSDREEVEKKVELTPESWEALPLELRAKAEHPLAEKANEIFNISKSKHNSAIIEANQILSICEKSDGKPTLAQIRQCCKTLSYLGLAVEPDARITGKKWNGSDKIVLFPEKTDISEINAERYRSAAFMLEVGLVVAFADGRIEESETSLLSTQIQSSFELSSAELRRLESLKILRLETKPTVNDIPKLSKDIGQNHKEILGKLILAITAADGMIAESELSTARNLFKRIDLDPAAVDRTYNAWKQSHSDGLICIIEGSNNRKPGEIIPPEVAPTAASSHQAITTFKIDREAVKKIMEETREVSILLGKSMNLEIEDEPVSEPLAERGLNCNVSSGPSFPTNRFTSFFEAIILQSEWRLADVIELARNEKLMPNEAIEEINNWAFEQFHTALLIEEGDKILVEKCLLETQ